MSKHFYQQKIAFSVISFIYFPQQWIRVFLYICQQVSIEKDAINRRYNTNVTDVNDVTNISSLTRPHVPPQVGPLIFPIILWKGSPKIMNTILRSLVSVNRHHI